MVIVEKFLMNMPEEEVYKMLKSSFENLNIQNSKALSLADFNAEKLIELVKTSHFDGTHADHDWKKKEVALYFLGRWSDDIITFLSQKQGNNDFSKLIE